MHNSALLHLPYESATAQGLLEMAILNWRRALKSNSLISKTFLEDYQCTRLATSMHVLKGRILLQNVLRSDRISHQQNIRWAIEAYTDFLAAQKFALIFLPQRHQNLY